MSRFNNDDPRHTVNDAVDQYNNNTNPTTATDDGYDSSSSSESEITTKPEKSRRPKENAFTQQRLKAINPVLTPKTVIPLLVAIAIVFVPLGAAMWYASDWVEDITIDYSQCQNLASTDYWSVIPDNFTDYHFRKNYTDYAPQFRWRLATDNSQPFAVQVLDDFHGPLFVYYRLHNFHANHRRYVKSFSEDQLNGKPASLSTIKDTVGQNCEPLSTVDGVRIYPCGLIANSLFNDTFSHAFVATNGTDPGNTVELTNKGIAWSSGTSRFKKTRYNYTEVVPPPNWYKMFPDGYNETNIPDISTWEEFHNWMSPSALPTFNKMALRNNSATLARGIYQIDIGLHFPVLEYNGKKFLYISQRSAIGGKNNFLGISWMVTGGICFILGLSLLVINFIKPRKTGDASLLSWNQQNE
ncbi:LEM3 Alkylphosphocholine resistance protein LEM3 [Candida maltosa Xu316]